GGRAKGYLLRYFLMSMLKSASCSFGRSPSRVESQFSISAADFCLRMLVPVESWSAHTRAPCTPLCAARIIHFQSKGLFFNLDPTRARRSVDARTSVYSSMRNHSPAINPSLDGSVLIAMLKLKDIGRRASDPRSFRPRVRE